MDLPDKATSLHGISPFRFVAGLPRHRWDSAVSSSGKIAPASSYCIGRLEQGDNWLTAAFTNHHHGVGRIQTSLNTSVLVQFQEKWYNDVGFGSLHYGYILHQPEDYVVDVYEDKTNTELDSSYTMWTSRQMHERIEKNELQ